MDLVKQTENLLKATALHVSTDLTRLGLMAIMVKAIPGNDSDCIIVGVDGHTLLETEIEWYLLKAAALSLWGVDLPESVTEGRLVTPESCKIGKIERRWYTENAAYEKFGPRVWYESVIPSKDGCDSKMSEWPVIGFETQAKLAKTLKLLGSNLKYWVPDYWGSRCGATVKQYGKSRILAMPMRVPDEDLDRSR